MRKHLTVAVDIESMAVASTAECCLSLWTYHCSRPDFSPDMSDSLAAVADFKAGLRSLPRDQHQGSSCCCSAAEGPEVAGTAAVGKG